MQISISLQPVFLLKVDIVLVFQFFPWLMGFPCGSASKNPPAMGETWVQSLVWEDPLQKGKATYSSTPVFWPREFHGLYSHIESETTERLSLSTMIEDTLLVDPGFFF